MACLMHISFLLSGLTSISRVWYRRCILVVEIIQHWFFSLPTHCDLASRSRSLKWARAYFAMRKYIVMPKLKYCRRYYCYVQIKHLSNLKCNCDLEWRSRSSDWEMILWTFRWTICTAIVMGISCSFWNNRTFIIFMIKICVSVWPWMKVKVNIISMWCIFCTWDSQSVKFDS